MRYHLFQKFIRMMVKIKETSFLPTRGAVCFALHCIFQSNISCKIYIWNFWSKPLHPTNILMLSFTISFKIPSVHYVLEWLLEVVTATYQTRAKNAENSNLSLVLSLFLLAQNT